MNTQAQLAQVDIEITELQAKLAKAQERRELLTLVKPAYDAALTQIDRVLDILLLVELSTEARMVEVLKFKAAIDSRFIPKSLEIGVTEIKIEHLQPMKNDSKRKPSGYRAKVLADNSFPLRPAQRMQFQVIIQELEAIGIKVGSIMSNRHDSKGWNLYWGENNDNAKLFWIVGQGWTIKALRGELTGRWEGFDLDDCLTTNGIDLEEYVA